jgi:nitroreductase
VSTTHAPAAPTNEALLRLVELASRAPSIHNTQPWYWRMTADGLDLLADRARQLRFADPEGRNLAISCGAALHHLKVAADALGWETEICRLPDGPASSVLARVLLRRGVPSEQAEVDLRAIDKRCTDRRRFTSWPVPVERLQHLADIAAEHGVSAVPLLAVTERFRAELLVGRAVERQAADPQFALEMQAWVDHSSRAGIPSTALPHDVTTATGARPSRFGPGLARETDALIEGADGLIVLCSGADDIGAWLRAGEGLSALWLAATSQGLSVVPLSQVVEVPETRQGLQQDVLGGLTHPLILVRIGWQAISRSQLPRTSRRPAPDVVALR